MRNLTMTDKVTEFTEAMGQPVGVQWSDYATDLARLRYRLVMEEAWECEEALEPEEILKELADIIYVAVGFAVTYGWDIETAFNRVHESNLSKLGDDGKPVYREDGKVTKGINYKPPYMGNLI